MGPHPKCEAHTRASIRQFWRNVMDGKYDRHGYTPSERAAKQRRDRVRRLIEGMR